MRLTFALAGFLAILMSFGCGQESRSFPQAEVKQQPATSTDKRGIVAEVNCSNAVSCGDDTDLPEARKSFEVFRKKRSKCPPTSPKHTVNSNLPSELSMRSDYCFPVRTATDHNICDQEGPYYWAPADQFEDGTSALSTLLNRAGDGQLISAGHIVVEAAESKTDERHLALCQVDDISGITGPPRECATVAIITPTMAWLRGGNPNQFMCQTSASLRQTGAIDIEFIVLTHGKVQQLSDALLKMMNSGLGLAAFQREVRNGVNWQAISLISAASLRDSQILLGGWREALDLDVDLWQDENEITVRGVAHVLLCRQALGNLNAYQGPDDSQRGIYASALDSRFDKAIQSVCKSYAKRDAKTISCD